MSKQRLAVGSTAPNISVLDIDGSQIDLAKAWSDGPVLLTFLRHFG